MQTNPTLHLICGKIASGKTQLAHQLAAQPGAVLISEDVWLAQLYPGQISSLEAYVRCSGLLRDVMGPHVAELLGAGLSVVLDFPANTVDSRRWMRGIFESAAAAHQLHYLNVPDAVCRARLERRNAAGTHDFVVSEANYDLFTRYFVPPSSAEGFDVTVYAER